MRFLPLALPGCFEVLADAQEDARGSFVKTFHREEFLRAGLRFEAAETFHSVSKARVLRGLHFHLPPREHAKLVSCLRGRVLDAVVDLRAGSPAFGKGLLVELSAAKANQLFIPAGVAHGFYAPEDEALMA